MSRTTKPDSRNPTARLRMPALNRRPRATALTSVVSVARRSRTAPGGGVVSEPGEHGRSGRLAGLGDQNRESAHGEPRVLFALTSGGHLAQAMALEPWFRDLERLWVTFDTQDALSLLDGERTVWAFRPTTRNIGNLIRNAWLAWKVTRSFRPDVVVSTGAGVALPFFVVAKLLRIPTVYIEVYDRIDSRTLSGRLCRPFSDLFLVQWPEQLELYPGAILVGRLL